jgi:hypothetical protein
MIVKLEIEARFKSVVILRASDKDALRTST